MDKDPLLGEVVDEVEVETEIEDAPESDIELLARLNTIYADKIKAQAAEFENFRNRTKKEMAGMYDRGVADAVTALLPILDNFALALKSADKTDGFAAGVVMIQNQIFAMLEGLGVTKIEAAGQPFDTKYHAAVSHIGDDSLPENTVAEELAAGYIYKENILRHAMVVVAN